MILVIDQYNFERYFGNLYQGRKSMIVGKNVQRINQLGKYETWST